MFDQFQELIYSLRAEAAVYPVSVQIWMKCLSISFIAGLVVAYWDKRAFWVAGMAIVTAMTLLAGKAMFPELSRTHIGSTAHLVIWPIAVFGLWRGLSPESRVFRYWRVWVSFLVGISLLLDAKTMVAW